jgi:hypothetical protein
MRPVYQVEVKPDGDCFPAAIASVLEVPLETVPHFCKLYGKLWYKPFIDWARSQDLGVIYLEAANLKALLSDVECVAVHRIANDIYHAVVSKLVLSKTEGLSGWEWEEQVLHDPNPEPCPLGRLQFLLILQKRSSNGNENNNINAGTN